MTPRSRWVLPAAGLAGGVWSLLPPYTGPSLNTAMRVEVADHVVPGAVVMLLSLAALILIRRPGPAAGAMFVLGLGVLLAGLWMTASHVPLALQGRRGQVPEAAVVYHAAPGVATLGLGLLWAASPWGRPHRGPK